LEIIDVKAEEVLIISIYYALVAGDDFYKGLRILFEWLNI